MEKVKKKGSLLVLAKSLNYIQALIRRHAMPKTIRQMIIDLLLEGPATAKDISSRLSTSEKEVFRTLNTYGKTCIMARRT
tara:strand:+ start:162 stop:401 length:240 start_codon:yes stop_codon:yes gene_type:complete